MSEVVRVAQADGVARVALARPDVRNAFNAEVIAALRDAFERLDADEHVRAVVLSGDGSVFSGGADVGWMRASAGLTDDENIAGATAWGEMFAAVDRCRKPVIARVQGAALGGGAGLCACADVVVAADTAVFGFTETKLGLIPAVVAPYGLARLGPAHARRYFLSGERFDAVTARAIGLVHEVVPAAELDARVDAFVREFASTGPLAIGAAKALLRELGGRVAGAPETIAFTAATIARVRRGAEAQEGLRAFLDGRAPAWRS